ncbi:Sensor protein ZraS [compost metagenome]
MVDEQGRYLGLGTVLSLQSLGELPRISCAPSQINQMLLKLFTNAAQSMDGPGCIQVKSWADADSLFISVQDSGRGMPPEVLQRIFNPFFTTKPVGEGMERISGGSLKGP